MGFVVFCSILNDILFLGLPALLMKGMKLLEKDSFFAILIRNRLDLQLSYCNKIPPDL
jgi:hypothetical protein